MYDTTGTINPTSSSPHLRTFSLREVSSCDDIVTQYYPPSLDNFEVLRRVSEPIMNVLTCQFLATLTVKYCGWDRLHKYAYGAKPMYRERQIRVSKGICLSLFHGEPVNFQIEGEPITLLTRPNVTTHSTVYLKGGDSFDGDCVGETFAVNGVPYMESIVRLDFSLLAIGKSIPSQSSILIPDVIKIPDSPATYDPSHGNFFPTIEALPHVECMKYRKVFSGTALL